MSRETHPLGETKQIYFRCILDVSEVFIDVPT